MKLGEIYSHPNSVKAITGISAKHLALLEEYRMALSLWSETRAIYSPETDEVRQATTHLEELERDLGLCDEPNSLIKQPPVATSDL